MNVHRTEPSVIGGTLVSTACGHLHPPHPLAYFVEGLSSTRKLEKGREGGLSPPKKRLEEYTGEGPDSPVIIKPRPTRVHEHVYRTEHRRKAAAACPASRQRVARVRPSEACVQGRPIVKHTLASRGIARQPWLVVHNRSINYDDNSNPMRRGWPASPTYEGVASLAFEARTRRFG